MAWPSPAQDYDAGPLDLNHHLILNAASTFVVRVRGGGLSSAGISDGDELIVDRCVPAHVGLIVMVVIDGEYRVGRLILTGPASPGSQPVGQDGEASRLALLTDEHTVHLPAGTSAWGVVTAAIHHLLPRRLERPGSSRDPRPGST